MKTKISILMFSLLLAVGWTNVAQAQAYTFKASDAKAWTYSWTDAQGNTHDNVDPTLEVTDPYQMYYFLRHVYMDKNFPGPYQSAYKADGTTRERDVYTVAWKAVGKSPASQSATPPLPQPLRSMSRSTRQAN